MIKNKYILMLGYSLSLISLIYFPFETTQGNPMGQVEISESLKMQKPVAGDTKADEFYVLNEYNLLMPTLKDMWEIESITFSHETPIDFDESWSVNDKGTNDLICYKKDNSLTFVGEKIFLNPNSEYLFASVNTFGANMWCNLKEINGLDLVDTSKVHNMAHMFDNNKNIKELDLNNWDVSNVTNMEFMFNKCTNLKKIYISDWDVSNVRKFNAMFQGDSHIGNMQLEEIDVSKWNTGSAVDMSHIFYGCSHLEKLDVKDWDVSNVKNFSHAFADCFNMKEFDVSNWNVRSVINFDAIFNDCRSIERFDISKWDTEGTKEFSQMFEACQNLKEIKGIEKLNVSSADTFAFSEMFHCCRSLKKLDLQQWDTGSADNMYRMFKGCTALEELNISGFKYDKVTTKDEMLIGVNTKCIIK